MVHGRQAPGSGFTLIELLVVIAIGAVLLAVGVPSFTYMIDRNRVSGEVNELLADLALTRSEALSRRARVVMCRSNNPMSATATCDGASTDWNTGWIVFVDDKDPASGGVNFQHDADETVVYAYRRSSPKISITSNPSIAAIAVTSNGTVFIMNSLTGTAEPPLPGADPLRIDIHFSDANLDNNNSARRSVCVATTGRARTASTFGTCA
jgi:prepilin-type N-terminal cleavage/methylation domain-containing protein